MLLYCTGGPVQALEWLCMFFECISFEAVCICWLVRYMKAEAAVMVMCCM